MRFICYLEREYERERLRECDERDLERDDLEDWEREWELEWDEDLPLLRERLLDRLPVPTRPLGRGRDFVT